jgi:hypothetical protein
MKAMQATETSMTAVIGATVCRCGRRTREGAAAATVVIGSCTVGEEARRGAVGDGGQWGMQKFMDKEECKNFLVTKHNISPRSFISMKFSSGCDHLFHEECGNSFTDIY